MEYTADIKRDGFQQFVQLFFLHGHPSVVVWVVIRNYDKLPKAKEDGSRPSLRCDVLSTPHEPLGELKKLRRVGSTQCKHLLALAALIENVTKIKSEDSSENTKQK